MAAAVIATRGQPQAKSGPISGLASVGTVLPRAEDILKQGVLGRQVLRCITMLCIYPYNARLSPVIAMTPVTQ